ncbi:MAG TPA: HTTM domain-containing protein, partial [Cyclobacteriaceae bacterium]
ASPKFKSRKLFEVQVLISNSALLLGQIQMALIYFMSGYDKLTSAAWRSGAAVHSITQLTFFQNPFINLALNEWQCVLLAWLIILFELGFAILIWFRKLRIPMLVMGVIFHLSIVFLLGLADFGILMILCYAVFLPVRKKEQHELMPAI